MPEPWAVPSPISVSNRTYLRQLQKWGGMVVRTNGDITVVQLPGGERIEMASAGTHKGNTAAQVSKMLGLLNITWAEFMTEKVHSPETQRRAVRNERLFNEARKYLHSHGEQGSIPEDLKHVVWDTLHPEALRENALWDKEKRKAAAAAQPPKPPALVKAPPKPAPAKEHPTKEPVMPATDTTDTTDNVHALPRTGTRPGMHGKYAGGPSIRNRVLDLLLEEARPIDIHLIAQKLQLRPEQATAACVGLVSAGAVRRVKQGVYMANDARTRQDIRLEDRDHRMDPHEQQPAQPAQSVEVTTTRVVTQDPVAPPELSDDTVNEILDLLLPNGFTGRDLRAVDEWRRATLKLLQEVHR